MFSKTDRATHYAEYYSPYSIPRTNPLAPLPTPSSPVPSEPVPEPAPSLSDLQYPVYGTGSGASGVPVCSGCKAGSGYAPSQTSTMDEPAAYVAPVAMPAQGPAPEGTKWLFIGAALVGLYLLTK